jgi:cytochrome oxidase Cu insertion factor (SCO1/SenC/PrrC family)
MMSNVAIFRKILWALPALVALALAFALGCGSSSGPARGSAAASASQSLPRVGNQVGNRIIPFTLRLADGSVVTSAELVNQNRATFLLFWKVN